MEIKADDLKKTGEPVRETPVKKVEEKKKTVSEIFLEECDEQEAAIFNEIKDALMFKRNKYEFEAVTEEKLNEYATMITYIKNGIITLEDDGVSVKLRKPLTGLKNENFGDSIKVLYERNESRENTFRKSVKTNPKSKDYDNDMGQAVIAASFGESNGYMIGIDTFLKLKKENYNDYLLLVNVYTFFRS